MEILKVHAKNVSLDETVDLDGIALATSGAVGSDLANMINEAAILAVTFLALMIRNGMGRVPLRCWMIWGSPKSDSAIPC